MKKKSERIEIGYGIKSIKEISYSMNDSNPVVEKELQISITVKVDFNGKNSEIIITPGIIYVSSRTKKDFLKIEVSNIFTIQKMKKFETKSKKGTPSYDFPEEFIHSLVGVSLSHSRAIMSKNTAGTKLEKYILPMMNPSDIMKGNTESKSKK